MTTIVDHLERHLGLIARGWIDHEQIKIVMFEEQPVASVRTYSTLGLSRSVLSLHDGCDGRQELVFSVRRNYDPQAIGAFLLTFAEFVHRRGRGLMYGDVVGPSSPLIDGVSANAVYAARPPFVDESFASFDGSTPTTSLVQVFPLQPGEAELAQSHGWHELERRLRSEMVDYWDLSRSSVTGPVR